MSRPLEHIDLDELLEVTEHTVTILKHNANPVFTPWIIMEELAIRLKVAQAVADTVLDTNADYGQPTKGFL